MSTFGFSGPLKSDAVTMSKRRWIWSKSFATSTRRCLSHTEQATPKARHDHARESLLMLLAVLVGDVTIHGTRRDALQDVLSSNEVSLSCPSSL